LEYESFKKAVGDLCGIDLSHYKSQQMDRRINSLGQAWGTKTYEEYLYLLKTNPQRFKEFVNRLTINVSEFFRNPERFQELWKTIFPVLLRRNTKIAVWSAGCSDGSEPYSVAIIIKELRAENRVKIIATDIDREIIKKAQEGIYAPNEIKSMPDELRNKYFQMDGNNFALSSDIKKMIEFRHHNLLVDAYPQDMDLIICRNVVIYFTEQAKNILYEKFYAALKPGGYLLVGGTEPILNYRQLGFIHSATSFYQKPLTGNS
jgi:chemotaxis protein methyltransferase CheR